MGQRRPGRSPVAVSQIALARGGCPGVPGRGERCDIDPFDSALDLGITLIDTAEA